MIDLRSDTVTLPTPEMKEFMMRAEVGDDVYGEDPSVVALQEYAAHLLGKEAALYVPSGTMANQIAVGVQTQPGDELICDPSYHVYLYEGGGIARLWGVTTRGVEGRDGFLSVDQLEDKIRPDDAHFVRTRLLCLENTINRGGGKVYPFEKVKAVSQWAKGKGLSLHLDGARLFNAVTASGLSADQWCEPFDTVSICLSKGLGAPMGSLIAGKKDLIKKAHRLRKVLGGGLRQAGFMAAAGLYALQHHRSRLIQDHDHAKILGKAVQESSSKALMLEFGDVETNLVWIRLSPHWGNTEKLAREFREKGILVSVVGPQLFRACTHLNITRDQIDFVAKTLREL